MLAVILSFPFLSHASQKTGGLTFSSADGRVSISTVYFSLKVVLKEHNYRNKNSALGTNQKNVGWLEEKTCFRLKYQGGLSIGKWSKSFPLNFTKKQEPPEVSFPLRNSHDE